MFKTLKNLHEFWDFVEKKKQKKKRVTVRISEAQRDTRQNLWVRAVFITLQLSLCFIKRYMYVCDMS